MRPRLMIAGTLLFAGCAVVHSNLNSATLILKPAVTAGGYGTHTVVSNYTQASIHHLILKLYTYDGTEHDQGIQKTLLNADLNKVVTFTSLKASTTYRIKAFAYASTDESNLISTSDANSYTDIPLTNDDHPTVASLRVKLIDRGFNGVATGGIAVTSGGYAYATSESWSVPYTVETVAGNGSSVFADAQGTSATFNSPSGITVDAQGNLYIADGYNYRIRKIDPSATVTTFAGNGTGAFVDATGASARLTYPYGGAIDALGNYYFCDYNNNRVRKIASSGAVSTVAGNGATAFADGTGTAATFRNPIGVAVDPQGNLFIGDYNNHRIRKIDTNGVVTTFAGKASAGYSDGTGTSAMFNCPRGLIADSQGNIYVADSNNHCIRKIDTNGVVTTFAGNGTGGFTDGIGILAQFTCPTGITRDVLGNLYVADRNNHRIRRVDPNGMVTTLAGNGGTSFANGVGTSATFNCPTDVTVDVQGYLYVADQGNNRIRRLH